MASGKPIGSFYVSLGLNTKDFRKNLAGAQRELRQAFGSAAIQTSQALAVSMAGLATAIGAVGAASVSLAADLERSKVSFTRLLGSATAADKKLRNLQEFAAKTPFTFTELVEYEKRLLALGFRADETKTYLTTFGDAASGLGLSSEGLGRIIKAFGDIKSKGVLATQEVKQLGEAGIGAWQILADGLGKNVPEIMDMVEKRGIDSATAITTLTAGLNQRFGGMMELQSNTMIGMWSTIRDETENIMRDIGQKIIDAFNLDEALRTARDSISKLRIEIEKSGLFNTLWNSLGEPMRVAVIALAGAITGALVPALYSVGVALLIAFAPLAAPSAIMAGVALIGYALYNFGTILRGIGDMIDGIARGAIAAIEGVASFFLETAKKAWLLFGQIADEILSIFKIAFKSIKALTWDLAKEIGLMLKNPFSYQQSDTGPLKTALNDVKKEWNKAFDDFKWPTMPTDDPGNAGLGWFKEVKKALPDLDAAKNKIKSLGDSITAFGSRTNTIKPVVLPGVTGTATGANKVKNDTSKADDLAKKLQDDAEAMQDYLQENKQAEIEALADRDNAYYESFQRRLEDQKLESVLERDKQAVDLAAYIQHLNDKTAAERGFLEGRREMIDTYDALQADANRSNMSYMAEGYRTVYAGLTDALTGIITGAKNAGEAFKELGMQIIQMVVKWQIQKRLAAVMSKSIEATQTAASVAMAATTAAAWAPAAAMVAAATFGASTAAGATGLASLSAMSKALTIPGLANGGVVSQPTLAMIGEGRESEAVLPLSKLDSMLSNGGGGVTLNVYNQSGQPLNARSSQRMDGRKTVIDLFLSGYNDNINGIQDVIGRR